MTADPTRSDDGAGPGPDPDDGTRSAPRTASVDTVEELVRRRLATALGGRRGILEAAVPTIVFTVLWLTTKQLSLALTVSLAVAAVALGVRVVQRSTVQFAFNAIVGIGIGWLFVALAARGGGDEDAQALAYFLPGLLYNAGYGVLMALTCLIGWPLVGFMVGSVTGDPTAWHADKQIVRLCTRLTWLLAAPCAIRVLVQAPIWLAGHTEAMSTDTAVALLGTMKIAMGWPLQLAALALMGLLLTRNHTPVSPATAD